MALYILQSIFICGIAHHGYFFTGSLNPFLVFPPLLQPNGTACTPDVGINSPEGNGIALYNILPEGVFTADQLLTVGPVRTALSYLTNNATYDLVFFAKGPASQVCTTGVNSTQPICILSSHLGCDGMLHITDGILLPSGSPRGAPATSKTQYDIPVDQLTSRTPNIRTCNVTLLQALLSSPDLSIIARAMQILVNESSFLNHVFNSSESEATFFAVTDKGNVRQWASKLIENRMYFGSLFFNLKKQLLLFEYLNSDIDKFPSF